MARVASMKVTIKANEKESVRYALMNYARGLIDNMEACPPKDAWEATWAYHQAQNVNNVLTRMTGCDYFHDALEVIKARYEIEE